MADTRFPVFPASDCKLISNLKNYFYETLNKKFFIVSQKGMQTFFIDKFHKTNKILISILMKTIKAILISIALSIPAFQSCTDEALEVENINQLALSSFYKTADDALYAVNACYTPLAHSGLFGCRWFFLLGSFEDRTLFETPTMDNISINSSNEFVTWMHRDLYMGVWRTSHVMRNLLDKDIAGLSEDVLEDYLAQIRALRAMYYYILVTVFDRPIFFDENSLPQDANQAYSNGEQIEFWDKIVEDLQYAIPILPDQYPDTETGRITSGAARALLGKAMLYKHYYYHVRFGQKGSSQDIADLELARDMLRAVMNSPVYSLVQPKDESSQLDHINAVLCNTSYMDLPASDGSSYRSENNSESIWEVQYSDQRINQGWLPGWQWSGNMNFQWFYHHESSFKNHEAHPQMYYEFESVTGHPAGFEKDPRTFASLYLDGDRLHFVPDEDYYSRFYTSGINNKKVASSRGLTIPGQPSIGFGIKKYAYPTYNDKAAPNNAPFNHRVIRLADVMLMYAEVMYILGDDGTGLQALNDVRDRVNMPPVSSLTPEAIIHERDVELAYEGHRYLDLIRWSFDSEWGIDWVEIFDGNVFTVGKNEFLPLPISEINVNRGMLEQNPGW